MLDLCRKYNVSVIVSSDSHCASDAGCHSYALELLKETGFPEELVVNSSLKKIGRISSLPVTVHPCLQLSRELLQANN